ncbi:MAG: DUF2064 domain-containing protein [Ginsengibacter sp.]
MTNSIHDTALLLFSHTAQKEALYKNFSPEHSGNFNKQIADQLIGRTIKIARHTKLPFFLIDEQLQRGSSFGERLTNAMADVFNKGFQKIIVIGNDCPMVSTAIINKAAVELQKNDMLLAPTTKGGVYIIGLRKEYFEKNSFEKIGWQTSAVFENMVQYAREKNIATCYFQCKHDINNYADLVASLPYLSYTDPFRIAITCLIASFHIFNLDRFLSIFHLYILSKKSLRGPPYLLIPA